MRSQSLHDHRLYLPPRCGDACDRSCKIVAALQDCSRNIMTGVRLPLLQRVRWAHYGMPAASWYVDPVNMGSDDLTDPCPALDPVG